MREIGGFMVLGKCALSFKGERRKQKRKKFEILIYIDVHQISAEIDLFSFLKAAHLDNLLTDCSQWSFAVVSSFDSCGLVAFAVMSGHEVT